MRDGKRIVADYWRLHGVSNFTGEETAALIDGGQCEALDMARQATLEAVVNAHAEGRREAFAGLQFAIDGLEHIIDGDGCATCAANFSQAQYLREAIRKLVEAERGGGG